MKLHVKFTPTLPETYTANIFECSFWIQGPPDILLRSFPQPWVKVHLESQSWNSAGNNLIDFLTSIFFLLYSVFYSYFFEGCIVWLWIWNNGTVVCIHFEELKW